MVHMRESSFFPTIVTTENRISPSELAARLRIAKYELAAALCVPRDAVSKKARVEAPKTQSRLRDMMEIINRILPWTGSELAAFAWYRSQPLTSFGDKTAENLVGEGRGEAINAYLSRIAEGGYAWRHGFRCGWAQSIGAIIHAGRMSRNRARALDATGPVQPTRRGVSLYVSNA